MKTRLPSWFKKSLPDPQLMATMKTLLGGLSLHTICESAVCPNIGECFSQKTATFLILGSVCTRNCTFCAVKKGEASFVDEEEPQHVQEAVERLGLRYVVITSVTRDDLPDGGASQFARTIRMLRENGKDLIVEVLIPDFLGCANALRTVVEAGPQVINHNVETVPHLYREVRPEADYRRSIELLLLAKRLNPEIITKSGIMLGLGETRDQVIGVMEDLREVNCDLLTIGQYLQPSQKHHPIVRFVPPSEFAEYTQIGKDMGFSKVTSAPLMRSSFQAAELYLK
ncbi:lipoyl synthase [Chloroflexota bacterium]